MGRIGLALSGGGFRATLYHLGVLRFLRDADALDRVSHITSVSGGSIVAAHLVMNWEKYTGTEEEFDRAAEELLSFIRMDVRNRVVRRYPLAAVANLLRWATRIGKSRRLTRPGLLETHYEKYLFGDKCLYELPTSPQLHILSTNINEGCLCSFTRRGLLVEHRLPDGSTRFEPIPSALATIPMAVTASSAFPGFFPPLRLTASDVGAEESQFAPHVFTDGGVYDNLGVRMFRHIHESWIGYDCPLNENDFADIDAAVRAFEGAGRDDSTTLSRLAQLVGRRSSARDDAKLSVESLPEALWNVIDLEQLYLEAEFDPLTISHAQANELIRLVRTGRQLDRGDHLWLNRCIANEAYQQATGENLFSSVDPEFDAVLVSDAGKQFSVSRRTTGGGLVGAAMRASDIVMDRVWQLECDHFHAEPGFIFAPMKTIVHLSEDPNALHPEIQRQVTNTRTDLDSFSSLEISGLIRHGYGVMRKVCRSHPELFGEDLPSGPPWDPTSLGQEVVKSKESTSQTTLQARQLQESSQRQILGRLLSLKDWPTYVYIPLLVLLFVGLPLFAYNRYRISHRSELIVDAITFSNPDFQLVLQLTRQNPVPGQWEQLIPEEVDELEPPDFSGFRLITDTRVLDARAWQPGGDSHDQRIVSYRRMLVRRLSNGDGTNGTSTQPPNHIRLQQFNPTNDVSVKSSARLLDPLLRVAPHVHPSGESGYMYEAEFDLSSVPTGDDFEVGFEVSAPGIQGRHDRRARLVFPIVGPTDVATMWVLLPDGLPYRDVEVISYRSDRSSLLEVVEPTYRFDMADGSLFGWMMVAPRDGYTYECRWSIDYD